MLHLEGRLEPPTLHIVAQPTSAADMLTLIKTASVGRHFGMKLRANQLVQRVPIFALLNISLSVCSYVYVMR